MRAAMRGTANGMPFFPNAVRVEKVARRILSVEDAQARFDRAQAAAGGKLSLAASRAAAVLRRAQAAAGTGQARHPAGAPGGKGGEFAPKHTAGGAGLTTAAPTAPLTGELARDTAAANAAAAHAHPRAAAALKQYIEDGETYYEVNSHLRQGSRAPRDAYVEDIVRNLDEGFKHVKPLEHDIAVHRGTLAPTNLKPGQTIAHRGYMSTAFGPGAASDFSGAGQTLPRGQSPSMFHIKVPKGTKAWGAKGREAEILLPRGGGLRIVRPLAPRTTPDGHTIQVWEAEYVSHVAQESHIVEY